MTELDMSGLPVTLAFVPVESTTGEPIEDLSFAFPLYRGVRAVPHVGHTIALPGGPWRVRQLVWDYPTTRDGVDQRTGQLVFVHIYREDGDE